MTPAWLIVRGRSVPATVGSFTWSVRKTGDLQEIRVILDVLTINDFFEMWVAAMEVNLLARFDDTITEDDQQRLLARYWQKTKGNWHGIADLLMVYREELGPFRDKPSRVITRDVIERVQRRLKQVDWAFTEETNESGNHKGANGRSTS